MWPMAYVGAEPIGFMPSIPARVLEEAATEAEDFRAVAPPVMSFASGRRR